MESIKANKNQVFDIILLPQLTRYSIRCIYSIVYFRFANRFRRLFVVQIGLNTTHLLSR